MKPENRFLNRLKPKLEKQLRWYVEKMNNPYRSGTPDWYVEWFGRDGKCGMGWIEAKFWEIKTRDKVSAHKLVDKCSPLQLDWLLRTSNNCINAGILCGFPDTKVAAFTPFPIVNDNVPVVPIPELIKQLQQWANNE